MAAEWVAAIVAAAIAVVALYGWMLTRERVSRLEELLDGFSERLAERESAEPDRESAEPDRELDGSPIDWKRKFLTLFPKVEGYLKERQRFARLYHDNSRQHGAAQDLLMNERAYFVKLLKQHKIDFNPHPTVEAVVERFRADHIESDAAAEARRIASEAVAVPPDITELAVDQADQGKGIEAGIR